jgi:hypothetical protein
MAKIDIFPISFNGIKPPLNLLYELFSSKLDVNNLVYPLDLASNPTYGHAVQFTVFDYEYPIAETFKNESIKNIIESPENWVNPINFKAQPKKNPKAHISLYMPDTLAFDYTNDWSQVSLTDTLGAAGLFGSAISDASKFLKDKGDYNSGNFANLITNPAALYATKKIAGEDAAALLGNVMKQVPNPQLQLLYKGIGLREFQFEFRFTPTSAKEAKSVDEIIKSFTYYSVPQLLGAASHQYLQPPQIFNIKFAFTSGTGLSGAISNFFKNIGTNILSSQVSAAVFGSNPTSTVESAPSAKIFEIYSDCVLTDMNIDYAPNGWAAYADGYPVETRLTLQFKEMDIVTKDNIRQSSNYFGGTSSIQQTISDVFSGNPSVPQPLRDVFNINNIVK